MEIERSVWKHREKDLPVKPNTYIKGILRHIYPDMQDKNERREYKKTVSYAESDRENLMPKATVRTCNTARYTSRLFLPNTRHKKEARYTSRLPYQPRKEKRGYARESW